MKDRYQKKQGRKQSQDDRKRPEGKKITKNLQQEADAKIARINERYQQGNS